MKFHMGCWSEIEGIEVLPIKDDDLEKEYMLNDYYPAVTLGEDYNGIKIHHKNDTTQKWILDCYFCGDGVHIIYIEGFPSLLMFLKEYKSVILKDDSPKFIKCNEYNRYFNASKIEKLQIITYTDKTTQTREYTVNIDIGNDCETILDRGTIFALEILKKDLGIE